MARRYRFARAGDVEQLLAAARDGRASVLDAHIPHLHRRWAHEQGRVTAAALHAEIRAMGYQGSYGTVRDDVRCVLKRLTAGTAPPGAVPPASAQAAAKPPKVREVVGWLLRHPDELTADEQLAVKGVRARCAHLDALADHVAAFTQMLVGRHGERLDAWLAAVEADEQPELHRFARGVRRDLAAVRNALSLPHSSGVVEGSVNRVKMLKRQMYGRAGLPLLRKRILLAA